MIMMTHITAFF